MGWEPMCRNFHLQWTTTGGIEIFRGIVVPVAYILFKRYGIIDGSDGGGSSR